MSDVAILHLSSDGATLLGAWVDHNSTRLRHYSPESAEEGAEDYAEALMTDRTWSELVESLPRTSAYIAWWELFERKPNESAEAVFVRAKSALELE